MQTSEQELVRKLVIQQHLNVPDRRVLPGGVARFSSLCVAAEEAVVHHGWPTLDWRPDDAFSGGLIEYRSDGTCRTYWKSEVSYQRNELQAVRDFATPREAVKEWLRTHVSRGHRRDPLRLVGLNRA